MADKKSVQRGSNEAKVLGKVVADLRKGKGLTQARLGEESDLDPKYIGLVENGRTNISLPNLLKLSDGLGISPGELLNAAFPPEDKREAAKPLLEELLQLVQEEDRATLEFLLTMLRETKAWEATRRVKRS